MARPSTRTHLEIDVGQRQRRGVQIPLHNLIGDLLQQSLRREVGLVRQFVCAVHRSRARHARGCMPRLQVGRLVRRRGLTLTVSAPSLMAALASAALAPASCSLMKTSRAAAAAGAVACSAGRRDGWLGRGWRRASSPVGGRGCVGERMHRGAERAQASSKPDRAHSSAAPVAGRVAGGPSPPRTGKKKPTTETTLWLSHSRLPYDACQPPASNAALTESVVHVVWAPAE